MELLHNVTMYVLIIISGGGMETSVITQEFYAKETCEAAAILVNETPVPMGRSSRSIAFCVPK